MLLGSIQSAIMTPLLLIKWQFALCLRKVVGGALTVHVHRPKFLMASEMCKKVLMLCGKQVHFHTSTYLETVSILLNGQPQKRRFVLARKTFKERTNQ